MFGNIFKKATTASTTQETPNQWIKCPKCTSLMYYKEVEAKQNVCPKCNHHFRISAEKRIASIVDEGSFVEMDMFVKNRSNDFGLDKQKPLGDGV